MDWARVLAFVTGMVDQELLARNEYLAAENRILKAQLKGRLKLSDAERATLGEIGHRWGRKVLGEPMSPGRTPSWPGTATSWPANSMARRLDEAPAGLGSSEKSSN
jgi:putative transposase